MKKDNYKRTIDMHDIVFRTENDRKIYYLFGEEIGEEYQLVRLFIQQGHSSSKAHKQILKIKEEKI